MSSQFIVHPRRRRAGLKMQAVFATGAFALGVFTALPVAAQDQPAAASKTPQVKEDMMQKSEKDVGYGSDTSFLTWHGYGSMEGSKGQATVGTFDLHEFYLSAKAQVSNKVSVTGEFEYEHAPQEFILPIQAYIDYAASPAFVVRAGEFFAPIGLPRTYTLRGNKNRLVRQVALTHDLMFENFVVTGVNVFGQFKNGFFYDTSVNNGMPNTMGTGDSAVDAVKELETHGDINNNKAVMGRFGYARSNDSGDLNVATSLSTEKYDPEETRQMNFAGVDARYQHRSGFRFQGEYMNRSGDDNPVDLENGIAADAYGWVAQFSKRTLFGTDGKSYWEPVFQVDAIDLNKHTDTNKDLLTTAVGFNVSPERHFLLKSEYDFVKEVHGTPLKNNKLWFGLIAEF